MHFDDILAVLGRFGRWHRITFVAIIIVNVLLAQHLVSTVFYQANPKMRCRLPNESPKAKYNLSKGDMDKNYPIDEVTQTHSMCIMFKNGSGSKEISCDNHIFDTSVYEETAATIFNMVCSNQYLAATADALFMVGYLIGSCCFGWLSDRYGRKPMLCITLMCQFACGVFILFSQHYVMYIIGKLGNGIFSAGCCVTAYVLVTEMVIPRHRLYAGQMNQLAYTIGYMLTALYAYLIRNWRYFYGLICFPSVLFLTYWFFVLESPRWLISTGRIATAKSTLKVIAKWNRIDLTSLNANVIEPLEQRIDQLADDNITRSSILEVFKYKHLRRNSAVLFLSWFSIAMTYFGLTFASNQLQGDDFINFFIAGISEFVTYCVVILTVNVWGRKYLYCGSMLLSGAFLLSIACIPVDLNWLILAFAMIGKSCCAFAFAVAYIYSVEIYPTVVRNSGLGACSTFARIGAIMAPYIGLTTNYWRPCPMVIFGVCVLISGCLCLFLPETLDKKLPETIEEGEAFR